MLRRFARELYEEAFGPHVFLWAPVAIASGIGIYFALPDEPPTIVVLLPLAAFWAAREGFADRTGLRALSTFLVLALIGASAAKYRVERFDHPRIEKAVSVQLTGTILRIEDRAERRTRLLLNVEAATARSGPVPLRRVRITIGRGGTFRPGDVVTVPARVTPPPGPVVPGGYDAARTTFFDGIDAVGFAYGLPDIIQAREQVTLDQRIDDLRLGVAQRIRAAHPDQPGALAVALLVGDRGGLTPESVDHLRRSGLAHVLAISGLHMSLFAGSAFFAARLVLAAFGTVALRWPVKKLAAVIGLTAACFYLVLSGAGTSTIRAFIMAAIAFLAILADRRAISLRNLAIAALPILVLTPESVLGPGFQMSFLSVAALVAVYDHLRTRRGQNLDWRLANPASPWRRRLLIILGGIALTTLIAGLATAPISVYHFQTVATYSVPANLLAMPLITFLIMPFGLLTLLAMPFGLESLPLHVMVKGLSAVIAIAEWIAEFDGAFLYVAKPAAIGIIATVAGMLMACIARGSLRVTGLAVAISAFAVSLQTARSPDLFIAKGGAQIAVRNGDLMYLSGLRAGSFVAEQWARAAGLDPANAFAPPEQCDRYGCLFNTEHRLVIAHIRHASIIDEECRRSDIIVSPLSANLCQVKAVPLRPGDDSAAIGWLGPPVVVREASGTGRPWQPGRPSVSSQ